MSRSRALHEPETQAILSNFFDADPCLSPKVYRFTLAITEVDG
jgi:hypothetical protein